LKLYKKNKLFITTIFLLSTSVPATTVFSANSTSVPAAQTTLSQKADKIVSQMTLKQKIGQLLIIGLDKKKVIAHTRSNIANFNPCGFIIMSYNNRENKKLKKFSADLTRLSLKKTGIAPIICSDKEGGYFTSIIRGLTIFPPNFAFAKSGRTNAVVQAATVTALELRKLGINMNLAPVLDVNSNPKNPIINTRAFSTNAKVVAKYAALYMQGMKAGGCITVGKHFPGHGATGTDSHKTLPIIKDSKKVLMARDIYPFASAISNGIPVIMASHIYYPALMDKEDPASISGKVLTELLRNRLGFKGVIMTDDINMDSIDHRMKVRTGALKAFKSGADIILTIANHGRLRRIFQTLKKAVQTGYISQERLNKSVKRIILLKLKYGIIDPDPKNILQSPYQPRKIQQKKAFVTLLKNREIINQQVANDATVLILQEPGIANFKDYKNIYLRSYRRLTKRINGQKTKTISWRQFTPYYISRLDKKYGKPLQLFFFTKKLSNYHINKIRRVKQRNKNIRIIRVVTGNPWAIKKNKQIDGYLYSFSRTRPSMTALANIIRGKNRPKTINIIKGKK